MAWHRRELQQEVESSNARIFVETVKLMKAMRFEPLLTYHQFVTNNVADYPTVNRLFTSAK